MLLGNAREKRVEMMEEEDGQGRNLHADAQIDAKQLLNSCNVEHLLRRQEERDLVRKG